MISRYFSYFSGLIPLLSGLLIDLERSTGVCRRNEFCSSAHPSGYAVCGAGLVWLFGLPQSLDVRAMHGCSAVSRCPLIPRSLYDMC